MQFKKFNTIDSKEIEAVKKVMKSGVLSAFYASKKGFYGGKKVQEFEKKLKKFYKVKYAITVNSWTSGLTACVGALDISPGDEVLVTPWTMSATVMAILHWGAIPVFVDIEKDTFCIDPDKIKKKITNKTKAIITVDIYGHPSNIKKIKKVIKDTKIKIIVDAAQAPYSFDNNILTGTNGDIGGYSFNCHKHIQTGEGGVVVTNNKNLARRVIRNHGENLINDFKETNISNIVGHNFRMTEIQAAIGIEQLKKLKRIVKKKNQEANYLIKKLKNLKGLITPTIRKNCTHSFYALPFIIDEKKVKIDRNLLMKKIKKEKISFFSKGYINIHKKKIAFGNTHFPWNISRKKIFYKNNICPVAERLHNKTLFAFGICSYDFTKENLDFICKKFIKIWKELTP